MATRGLCAEDRDAHASVHFVSPKPVDESRQRTHLAVVPIPEQPELPIPSPAATPLPSIALVRSEAIMAEVAFVGTSAQRTEKRPGDDQHTCEAARHRQDCRRLARREARTLVSGSAGIDHGAERRGAACVVYLSGRLSRARSAARKYLRRHCRPTASPTTILPLTSSLPASSAARPMAPPGSTTSFSSLNA